LAAICDLPVIASNDVRFLAREDFRGARGARVHLDRPGARRPETAARFFPEQYLKSAEEMADLFADIPEALRNTVELAKRCNFELTLAPITCRIFRCPKATRSAPGSSNRSAGPGKTAGKTPADERLQPRRL